MPKNRKRAIPLSVLPPEPSPYPFRTGGVGFEPAPPGWPCERCGYVPNVVQILVVSRSESIDVPSVQLALTLCSACLAEAYHAARGVRFPERAADPVAVVHDLATGSIKLY